MIRVRRVAGFVCYALLLATSVAAQTVSASTNFEQFINSPPELVCTGNASVEYSGGVLLRIEVHIMAPNGQLKAKACDPHNCWTSAYTPSNPIGRTVTYQVDLNSDPTGNYTCVVSGTAQLDYTDFIDFSSGGSQTVEPRVPADLRTSTNVPDTYTFTSPGNYLRTRTWQVWDNYQLTWTYANMPVNESYTIGQNGCNIQIATASAVTQPDGTFTDKYGNHDGSSTIPACISVPSCTTQSTQTITVAGTPFSHGVTWGCSDVQISRQ